MIIFKNVFLGLISVLVTLAVIEVLARIFFFFAGFIVAQTSRVFEPYFVSGDAFENFSNNVFARGDGSSLPTDMRKNTASIFIWPRIAR